MSSYEFVHEMTPFGPVHKVKYKDKKTGMDLIYRSILEIPVDKPLCEIIEEFGIPIFRKKGIQYKVQYVARVHLQKKLDISPSKFKYHEDRIKWIHKKEFLTEKEYKTQVGKSLYSTQLNIKFKHFKPILYSLGDAIQILGRIQTEEKKSELIRKLIIKLEVLQKKLNKYQKAEIENLHHLLEQLDDVCYDWIKEHQNPVIYRGKEVYDNFAGYVHIWGNQLWQMIIDLHYRIKKILGLPVPKREYTGLHHLDRPYRRVYPHIATRGKIIDSRYDHDDPRQKKFKI